MYKKAHFQFVKNCKRKSQKKNVFYNALKTYDTKTEITEQFYVNTETDRFFVMTCDELSFIFPSPFICSDAE